MAQKWLFQVIWPMKRALHILDAQGLIDVPDESFVAVDDITENDKNLSFTPCRLVEFKCFVSRW